MNWMKRFALLSALGALLCGALVTGCGGGEEDDGGGNAANNATGGGGAADDE